MLKETFNNNNNLSDESLNRALVMAKNFSAEANIRFKIGAPETSTIGDFKSVGEIFGKALMFALDEAKIGYDKKTFLESADRNGLRKNFDLPYDKKLRQDMVGQLRDILTQPALQAALASAKAPTTKKQAQALMPTIS